jgi:hypothetical protein
MLNSGALHPVIKRRNGQSNHRRVCGCEHCACERALMRKPLNLLANLRRFI